MHHYAGIGSRETPTDILTLMEEIAYYLALDGYVLRSGGAPGADTAFEEGAKRANGKMEIYLPWKKFNQNTSSLFHITKDALELGYAYHPAGEHLAGKPVAKLMARNCYQILGEDLKTPSKFVVCYTKDKCITRQDRTTATGGTGQAIALSYDRNIAIYNLSIPEHLAKMTSYIASKQVKKFSP